MKNSQKSIIRKQIAKSKKQAKDLFRHFTNADTQMAIRTWKEAQHHQSSGKCTREPQDTTTHLRANLILLDFTTHWQRYQVTEISLTMGMKVNGIISFEKFFGFFLN